MTPKVEHLIVDTSAFIKNTQLQNIAENLITVSDVVNEIKNKRQLRRLVVLPYDLKLKDVDPENVILVTEFSKKTGDYSALSVTDLKVLALTYQLHKEIIGLDGIKSEPVTSKSVEVVDRSVISTATTVGFHLPSSDSGHEQEVPDIDEVSKKLEKLECRESDDDHNGSIKESEDEEEDDDPPTDDEDWITPGNIAEAKRELWGAARLADDCPPPKVACLSTDFAIQNVLKQMGLNVVTIDGLLIKQVRTFILRCFACFKTTSLMEKIFCPNCGNKTLKRVAVTVDEDGKEVIHINFRRPLTGRGKKVENQRIVPEDAEAHLKKLKIYLKDHPAVLSVENQRIVPEDAEAHLKKLKIYLKDHPAVLSFPLPKFEGGKHSNNPLICEDQRVPQQRPTKASLAKTNAMDPDYIAGVSPFSMRDVSSRAAVLGIHQGGDTKSWMRKNPNQVVKRKRKK